ncbi:MAG: hypothetical protein PVF45_13285, partial [Anaerolineae bacterium]
MEIQPQFRLARRWSLRAKIIAWFFVPTAVILVVVAWATFYAYQRLTEELVIERDLELTRLVASELNRELYEYFELLSLVARDQDEQVRESLSQSIVSEQADSIIRLRGETGRAYLVD